MKQNSSEAEIDETNKVNQNQIFVIFIVLSIFVTFSFLTSYNLH